MTSQPIPSTCKFCFLFFSVSIGGKSIYVEAGGRRERPGRGGGGLQTGEAVSTHYSSGVSTYKKYYKHEKCYFPAFFVLFTRGDCKHKQKYRSIERFAEKAKMINEQACH
jgi:hypothetical protein